MDSSFPALRALGLQCRTGSGGGGDSSSTIGGGGASADAWTRLVSSGVEDDLVACAVGTGAGFGAAGLPYGHFLDACFLCRTTRPKTDGDDILGLSGAKSVS